MLEVLLIGVEVEHLRNRDHIMYYCPNCDVPITDKYKGKQKCSICGAYFDWPEKEPCINKKGELEVEWRWNT